MAKVHQFNERLLWSDRAGDEPFWEAVYRKAFPTIRGMTKVEGPCEAQRQGVDRLIVLANNMTIRIDEKKREKAYPDILLEIVSNSRTNAPGWINKDLSIDYLAYAFMETKVCYLFPWLLLRRAWLCNQGQWLKMYPLIAAQNPGYQTISVAIPIIVLRNATSSAAIIDVSLYAI